MSINDNNYIVIQGWMRTQLNLKGNELLVFAILYGFCQDGGEFCGSLQYLADFIGTSKPTVINALKSLEGKKLITKKTEIYPNNVRFNTYKISLEVVKNFNGGSKDFLTGVVKNFNGGSKKILPNNNIDNNNINNKIDTITSTDVDPEQITPQNVIDLFHKICISYPKVKALSEARRKAINARLRVYGLETIKEVFELAEKSDFLKGKNDRNWSANFDWIMSDRNFAKILDGNYQNRTPKKSENYEPDYLCGWDCEDD